MLSPGQIRTRRSQCSSKVSPVLWVFNESMWVFFFSLWMVDISFCQNKEKKKKEVSTCHGAKARWRETVEGEGPRDRDRRKWRGEMPKKERQRVRLIGSVPSAHLNANHPSFCLCLSHTYTRQINKDKHCNSIDNDWQTGQMVIYLRTQTHRY